MNNRKTILKPTTKGLVMIELMEEFSEGHTAPVEVATSKARNLIREFEIVMGMGIFDALREAGELDAEQIAAEMLAWKKEQQEKLSDCKFIVWNKGETL